jgi:hypothetical protein
MKTTVCFLAEMDFSDVVAGWQTMDDSTRQTLLVFGAILLTAVVAWAWVIFARRRRRQHHSHHHSHRHSHATADAPARPAPPAAEPPVRRRKLRHRRSHRPRNPTLAETGGLPPIRAGAPPEPPH